MKCPRKDIVLFPVFLWGRTSQNTEALKVAVVAAPPRDTTSAARLRAQFVSPSNGRNVAAGNLGEVIVIAFAVAKAVPS
jgi:hypothetical protein